MKIFFDTSILVYLVERVSPWHAQIQMKLAALRYDPVISDLTRMEALVQPLRAGNVGLIAGYGSLFATCEIVPMTSDVIDQAMNIRANHSFKTPDAIHLADALESGCDWFFTNDRRLSKFTGVNIKLL